MSETQKNNNSLPYIIIIILLIIIAVLAFFVGRGMNGGVAGTTTETVKAPNITVIDDKRCSDCNTQQFVDQLKALPFLATSEIEVKDFSDAGSEEMLKASGLTKLPAIIFEHNKINDYSFLQYLKATLDGKYSLDTGAKFDPYAKRSDRGFFVLAEGVLDQVKDGAYIEGNKDADITWIEYSDVECPFCAKLHNDGTPKQIMEEYGEGINKIFQHFPLSFHPQAQKGAETLECIAEQNSGVLYEIITESYKKYNNNNFKLDGLYDIAAEKGIDKKKLEACVDSGKYEEKVTNQMNIGQSVFGVTGTPGNILINNKTGEYEVLSGAYPFDQFKAIIDRLK